MVDRAASAAKNHAEPLPTREQAPGGSKRLTQRGGCMREIDYGAEFLSFVNWLHAPWQVSQRGDALLDRAQVTSDERCRRRRCCRAIRSVINARER